MGHFPDAESFRPFVEKAFAPLASFARSVLGSELEAEDVAQEALVQLYWQRSKLQPERPPEAYLYRIALRICFSRLRRETRRATLSRLAVPLSPRFAPPPADPLDGWFRTLPKRQRAIAHLYFGEDRRPEEIGVLLGIAASTVRAQLTRIRKVLRTIAPHSLTQRCPDVS